MAVSTPSAPPGNAPSSDAAEAQRIRSLAASGCPVVLIGSDLEEVEQVCDRAIVMERGRIRGVLSGEAVTAASLLQAAYGVDE